MSDPTAQEPTMEEILASIRRIISEDDQAPAPEAAAAPAPAPAPPPEPEPAVFHHAPEPELEEDDVLELNEPAPPITPRETHGDLDVFEAAHEPTPMPEPSPVYAAHHDDDDDPLGEGLVSGHVAGAAASHFGALAHQVGMPDTGRTLEDVVRAMLRPLLKDWLDQYLPGMVEQAVRDEVERIARRRVY